MSLYPNADQVARTMELTGFDGIQARNHLIGQERVRQINAERHRQAVDAAVRSWIDSKPAPELTRREKVLKNAVETALTVFQRMASGKLQGPAVPDVYARAMAAALEEAGL